MTGSSNSLGANDAGPNISETAAKAQQLAEVRKKCRTDKLFLSSILGYDFQPDVHNELFEQYIPFDNAKDLFDQHAVKRRLVLWSRTFYKTTSIIVEAIQLILNFPDVSIMLMKADIPKGKEMLAELKRHFTGDNPRSQLIKYFPEFCSPSLGTALGFIVPARQRSRIDPTVFVASPKASKAGFHPDVAFFDDLVHEVNFRNPALMKKVIDDFALYTPLVLPGGYFYVTGTRYTFGDLYEHIIREEMTQLAAGKPKRWNITTKSCWKEDENGVRIGDSNFPPRKLSDGRTIGISLEELLAIQANDPEMFAAQYQNRPIAAGTQTFTPTMLAAAFVPPDKAPALNRPILVLDLATGKDGRADDRVIAVGATDAWGRVHVIDLRGGRLSIPDLAAAVIEMALKHRPVKLLIEGNSAGHVFNEYVKLYAQNKGLNINLEFIKVNTAKGAKEIRIESLLGRFRNKTLFFLIGLLGWEKMVEQFVQFPKGHDDYPDAIALLVQEFSKNVPERPFKKASFFDIIKATPDHAIVKAVETPLPLVGLGSDFA